MHQNTHSPLVRSLLVVGTLAAILGAPGLAHAEVSQRTKMIVWAVDRFEYMSDCRFDKPSPAHSVNTCVYQLGEQSQRVDSIPKEEHVDPAVQRILALHEKSKAYVAKVKAAAAAEREREGVAKEAREKWIADVQANEAGLAALARYDSGNGPPPALPGAIVEVRKLGPFAQRCAEGNAKLPAMKRRFTSESLLVENPTTTCSLAERREDILKRAVPPALAAMRKSAKEEQLRAATLIAKGELMEASSLNCARDFSTCVQMASVLASEKLLGLPSSAETPDSPAFLAAVKAGTKVKRVGSLRDAAREAPVARALREDGHAPLATAVLGGSDTFTKNAFGIPQTRYRLVSALLQMPGETFCRVYVATAIADYAGGGKYGAFGAELPEYNHAQFRISGCR